MPIVVRSIPISRSHAESVENTSMNGRPAENPRNSIASTLGCLYDANAGSQPCHQRSFEFDPAAAPATAVTAFASVTGRSRS
jgi:hypothetical protein